VNETIVENLLQRAKVKRVPPEALATLTQALIKAASRIAVVRRLDEFKAEQLKDEEKRGVEKIKPLRTEFERAQAAINELRRAGAKIVNRMRAVDGNDPNFSHYSELAGDLDAWFKTLPVFVADAPHEPKPWVAPAKFILLHFQHATGIKTISRGGPAVRFIKEALVTCGAPDATMISHAAIEKAITAK